MPLFVHIGKVINFHVVVYSRGSDSSTTCWFFGILQQHKNKNQRNADLVMLI